MSSDGRDAAITRSAYPAGLASAPERTTSALDDTAAALRADGPPRIGRYELRHVLGRGAMGEVWLARDPRLSREVAVKVVRRPSRILAERLVREARAMARLSHPNVVGVFDVGTFGTRGEAVYIVMELVRGVTLLEWSARRRSRDEIVAMFVQAGQGLAAAHQAGLVHRDFKPANVLVGDDGRARVGDFGLAHGDAGRPDGPSSTPSPSDAEGDLALTETGMVMGTPLYMAPEQHRGGRVDARSDQYAFCVALYEALIGRRPFAEGTRLLTAKLDRRLVEPDRGHPIPKRILDVVRRGIAPDAVARWPTMEAVIERLQPKRHLIASPVARSAAIAVGLGLAGVAGAWLVDGREPACPALASLGRGWSETTRREIFDRVRAASSTEVATRLVGALESEVQRLRDALAIDCGRDDRCTTDATTKLLATIDAFATDDRAAADAATFLDAFATDRCDPRAASGEDDVRLQELHVAEITARARWRANLQTDAVAELRAAHERALALGPSGRPMAARFEYQLAMMYADLGDSGRAREWSERAYWSAVEVDDDDHRARASAYLAALLAETGEHAAALQWRGYADAALARGRVAECSRFEAGALTTSVRWHAGEQEQARRELEPLRTACPPDRCPDECTNVAAAVAGMMLRLGEVDAAVELQRELLAQRLAQFGDEGPAVATMRADLAFGLVQQRNGEEALREANEAIAGFERAFGTRHRGLATAYMNRAMAHGLVGRHEDAVADARHALSIDRGGEHNLWSPLLVLANGLGDAGEHDAALEIYDRLLASGVTRAGEAAAMISRGYTRFQAGDHRGALLDARESRAWLLEHEPAEVAFLLLTWGNEAVALQALGDCEGATRVADEGMRWARDSGRAWLVENAQETVDEIAAACGPPVARRVGADFPP